jgi:hypothetical protein
LKEYAESGKGRKQRGYRAKASMEGIKERKLEV